MKVLLLCNGLIIKTYFYVNNNSIQFLECNHIHSILPLKKKEKIFSLFSNKYEYIIKKKKKNYKRFSEQPTVILIKRDRKSPHQIII